MSARVQRVRVRTLLLIVLSIAAVIGHVSIASGQIPSQWVFPVPVPCDSVWVDSIPVFNTTGGSLDIVRIEFRDSLYFKLGSLALPLHVETDSGGAIPITFGPLLRLGRRDSIRVLVRRQFLGDTLIAINVTGTGVGPSLTVDPIVLNYPRTNPGFTATLSTTVFNKGELPITLMPGDVFPPAPFLLSTPLPVSIPAGDSIVLTFDFQPTEAGFFGRVLTIPSGCGTIIQIGLNGVTDIEGTGAVIRSTKLGFEPANRETYPCEVSACTDVTISNVGNAPLRIEDLKWALDTTGYVLVPQPQLPAVIPPGESMVVKVCLSGQSRGVLQDTLIITSNNRASTVFGLVLDASTSMNTRLNCPPGNPRRIDEVIRQAQLFIARTLLYLPGVGIQDQLSIVVYGGSTIQHRYGLNWFTDIERTKAQDTLNNLTLLGGTPTGRAMDSMIRIISRSPLNRRVIVLLSDGQPTGSDPTTYPVGTLVTRANAAGIKIFTIGIGVTGTTASNYLRQYADGTGGAYFDANNCGDLQTAFETITDLINRGAVTREPFYVKVTAPNLVLVPVKPFDSTHIGQTVCQQTTITNIGEGDAVVDSINVVDLLGGPNSDFSLARGVQLPLTIREGEQIMVPVCFTPQRIRMRQASGVVDYNSCGVGPATLGLIGPGYAYANLRVDDQRVALPGSIVTLPIYADSSLVDYDVKTISYHVRWNKSMLDLREVRPLGSATGASVTEPLLFDKRSATASISVTGLPKFNGGEAIAELEFQVLRGDTLATLVELVDDAVFEDGNPRRLLKNAGLIAFDSTCFREYKPIGFGVAAKVVVGEPSPTPAPTGIVTISVTSDASTILRIDLFSVTGTVVTPTVVQEMSAGTADLAINLTDLPNGRYYISIRTPDGVTSIRNLVIAK